MKDETVVCGIPLWKWERGERFLREFFLAGGRLRKEDADRAASDSGYPTGYAGYLRGKGDLKRDGDYVRVTDVGARDYARAVSIVFVGVRDCRDLFRPSANDDGRNELVDPAVFSAVPDDSAGRAE